MTDRIHTQPDLPAVTPACPSWCALPAGHEYHSWSRSVEDGTAYSVRLHISASDKDVWLVAQENNADGAATLLPPEIVVDLGGGGHIGDVEYARRLGWEILAAAELLDHVTRS